MASTIANLGDLIEPLKRQIAVPGDYDEQFPNTDDDGLLATLADSFGQAQLDGFFAASSLDLLTTDVTPELSLGEGALLVLYAGIRIIQSKLRQTNLTAGARYKAGAVEYETSVSANYLTAELASLEALKKRLLQQGQSGNTTAFFGDGYLSRMYNCWYDGGCVESSHLY